MLKLIYSEKDTKFCKIVPLILIVCTVVKSKGKISQNFSAFSEYMNFKDKIKLVWLCKTKSERSRSSRVRYWKNFTVYWLTVQIRLKSITNLEYLSMPRIKTYTNWAPTNQLLSKWANVWTWTRLHLVLTQFFPDVFLNSWHFSRILRFILEKDRSNPFLSEGGFLCSSTSVFMRLLIDYYVFIPRSYQEDLSRK